ncbi:MAG: ABC transporter substrate-binding protein [Microcoleaceae cyanobacterium]
MWQIYLRLSITPYTNLILGLSLLVVGCGTGQNQTPTLPTTYSTVSEEGSKVTILGSITGAEQDKLEAALAPFVEATGIEVEYQGTSAFASLLPVRVEAGNPPDVALFPQPGLMADFARQGALVPITSFIKQSQLDEAYSEDWLQLGSVDNELYGIWVRASVKSLVWYNPKAFEAAGYEVPQTWSQLQALSQKMVQQGEVPWCLGIESGEATGWVGTDWIEDIVLRTSGPEVYDQWVRHDIPFNDPAVRLAFEKFGDIALNPQYVVGGTMGVINTPYVRSANGLFTDPPGCYLHRQASFIASFFPEGVVLGEDVDVFPLPPIKPELGLPILVGGDVIAMFNDTPEARKLMEYLATVQPHQIWASMGSYISPHKEVNLDRYPNPVTRKQAEILGNADVIRFDASDMMPGTVGTGAFWLGVVEYIEGADVDTVLVDINQSWPQSSPQPVEN